MIELVTNAAAALADSVDAPVWLHPDDRMLWDAVYPDRAPDRDLVDGTVLRAGGVELGALHMPGHSPGCVCLHAAGAGAGGPTGSSAGTRCSAAARAPPAAAHTKKYSNRPWPTWPSISNRHDESTMPHMAARSSSVVRSHRRSWTIRSPWYWPLRHSASNP